MNSNLLKTAYRVTLHCMLGCLTGESIGLFIGVSLSWHPFAITIFSTILAFISGLLLAIIPMLNKHNLSWISAIKIVWFGESISVITMEVTMNGVDYYMGGMTVSSVYNIIFWYSLITPMIAGYIAALPINYWLVKEHFKKCHS